MIIASKGSRLSSKDRSKGRRMIRRRHVVNLGFGKNMLADPAGIPEPEAIETVDEKGNKVVIPLRYTAHIWSDKSPLIESTEVVYEWNGEKIAVSLTSSREWKRFAKGLAALSPGKELPRVAAERKWDANNLQFVDNGKEHCKYVSGEYTAHQERAFTNKQQNAAKNRMGSLIASKERYLREKKHYQPPGYYGVHNFTDLALLTFTKNLNAWDLSTNATNLEKSGKGYKSHHLKYKLQTNRKPTVFSSVVRCKG